MTGSSPPAARVVALINFLASHPDQAFTLSEIAKSLRMSSATCYNLLQALTGAGYIYRTAGKTYLLGSALVRIGQAAASPASIMQVARPEMRLIADEFDVVCTAFHLEGDRIVVRERAAAVSHLDWNPRYPWAVSASSPGGWLFHASDRKAFDDWLKAATPPLGAGEETKVREAMRFLESRGYTFGVRKAPLVDYEHAKGLQNRPDLTDFAMSAIDSKQHYELAHVAAPVFSAHGGIEFGLSLGGFVKSVRGDAVEAIGARLRQACDRIGDFIAGRVVG